MTSAFFDDPENRMVLRICQTSPGFIPIVLKGKLHPVRESNIAHYPVSENLSSEDFALGLEVLGCRLVRTAVDDVVVQEPAAFRTPVWRDRARQIQAVMNDFWEGRGTALSEYLKQRA
ncbi:hypothetical protein [Aureimonas sp. AU20]|uniref:hypothetical protein n=1 Tax=Aureimonas sp. AU20 TaxID=1349819 RepID=UPI00071EE6B4|nr:hypothetical protein [Aureimonas sp. AU20]ALN75714.1 hypothetical protein M673_23495 [Aureimonas sp. AU20]